MPTTSAPEQYLSLNELARKANISYPTALRLAAAKIIEPDAFTGRTGLYKASRWEELRQIIRDNVIPYGVSNDYRFITDASHPLHFQS
ncbi:MAG: hypothetical protein QOE70_6372 [Chthoniobacter sp.]|jgi:hypothetical protein|nr:hypothetical protein [Chthoniobacter sp.]